MSASSRLTGIMSLAGVLLLGTLAQAWAGPSSWTRTISVSEAGEGDVELEFGVRPPATDGVDAQLGQAELPPLGPGFFEARFTATDGTLGNGVDLDLRNGSQDPQAQHTLIVSFYRVAGGNVTLSWDPDLIAAVTEEAWLRDPFDDIFMFEVDMRSASTLEITSPGVTSAKLVFTSKPDVAPDDILIIQQPASTTISGQPVGPMTVEVQAVYLEGLPFPDNAVAQTFALPNQSVTVSLGSGDGHLDPAGTLTYLTDENGLATLDGVIYHAAADGESFTLTATVNGISVTSDPVTAEIPVEELILVQQPGPVISGQPMSAAPMIVEVLGQGVPLANRQVLVDLATGDGTLDGTFSYLTDANGRAELDGVIYDAMADGESFTLTATVNGISVTSDPVTAEIPAVPVDELNLIQQPGPVISGQPMSAEPMIVEVRGEGAPLAGRTVTVTLATGDGLLAGTTSYPTDADGLAALDGVIYTAAADGETFTLTATVNGISVTSDPVTAEIPVEELILVQQPGPVISGQPMSAEPMIVEVRGQGVPLANRQVLVDLATGDGTLDGTLTYPTDANGLATLDGVIYHAAADGESFTLTATVNGISVTSAPVTAEVLEAKLVFTVQPGASVSGFPLGVQPVVTAYDDFGDVDVTFTDEVTLSLFTGDGMLTGTESVHAVDGVATFTDLVYRASVDQEQVMLLATGGGLSGTSSAFIAEVVATQLVFTTQPDGSVSGLPLTVQPVVSAQDADGLVDTDFNETVTLSLDSGAGDLAGTQEVVAVAGVASFADVTYFATADGETASLQAVGGGLPAAGSDVFIADVVATQLVFTTQPDGSVSGSPLTTPPVVTAQDAQGLVDIDFTATVTLDLDSGEGALSGTLNEDAVGGVADFTDVIYTAAEDHEPVTLSASGGRLSGTSDAFTSDVVADELVFLTEPEGGSNDVPVWPQPVLAAQFDGVTDRDYSGLVTLTRISGTGTLSGTLGVPLVDGVAEFTDVEYNAPATELFRLQATTPGLPPVSTADIEFTRLGMAVIDPLTFIDQDLKDPETGDPLVGGTEERRPSFSWSAASGALAYTLQLADNPDFDAPRVWTGITATTHTVDTVLPDGDYYVRVIAEGPGGSTMVSQPVTFTVVPIFTVWGMLLVMTGMTGLAIYYMRRNMRHARA